MNETSFIKSIHNKLPKDIYKWKIRDTYTSGIPDAMYAGPAGFLFIEYKYIKIPKRSNTEVQTGLSELQKAWLTRMASYNLLVFVVIGSDLNHVILKNNWHRKLLGTHFINGLTTQELVNWLIKKVTNERSGQ